MCVPGEEEEQPIFRVLYKVLPTHQYLPFRGAESGCEHILIFPLPPYVSLPL